MIPKAILKVIKSRNTYRTVFRTPLGREVIDDLIKKYIIASPIGENADVTLINLGKQALAQEIIRKALGNDKDLYDALERSHQPQPQEE